MVKKQLEKKVGQDVLLLGKKSGNPSDRQHEETGPQKE